jgi:hypothetical protein
MRSSFAFFEINTAKGILPAIITIKLVMAKYFASLKGFTSGIFFLKRFGDIILFRDIDPVYITFKTRKENRGVRKEEREIAKQRSESGCQKTGKTEPLVRFALSRRKERKDFNIFFKNYKKVILRSFASSFTP